jgi:chromatin segregation and condensation protein Rec8/ScpA/Scc1 (kleisin family)
MGRRPKNHDIEEGPFGGLPQSEENIMTEHETIQPAVEEVAMSPEAIHAASEGPSKPVFSRLPKQEQIKQLSERIKELEAQTHDFVLKRQELISRAYEESKKDEPKFSQKKQVAKITAILAATKSAGASNGAVGKLQRQIRELQRSNTNTKQG